MPYKLVLIYLIRCSFKNVYNFIINVYGFEKKTRSRNMPYMIDCIKNMNSTMVIAINTLTVFYLITIPYILHFKTKSFLLRSSEFWSQFRHFLLWIRGSNSSLFYWLRISTISVVYFRSINFVAEST